MKRHIKQSIIATFVILGFIIPAKVFSQKPSNKSSSKVLVRAKAFDGNDCQKYLDRDVISAGYQPVQIIIKNRSDRDLSFNPHNINLPIVPIEHVTQQVHTSTAGRIAGYGAASLFVSGLFLIPAIVDGVKSSDANKALDADYAAKSLNPQILRSGEQVNGLIFVPNTSYTNQFSLELRDTETDKLQKFHVSVC